MVSPPGDHEGVVVGFVSARVPLSRRLRTRLVGPHDGGADGHPPVQQPGRVRPGLALGEQVGAGAVGVSTAEPGRTGLPEPVAVRQVPPGHPGTDLEVDPVEHPPVIHPRPVGRPRQQRLDQLPLGIGQLMTPHHGRLNEPPAFEDTP